MGWGAAVNTDEASLTRPSLTSCCAARFLTGHGPLQVHGLGVGDPCSNLDVQVADLFLRSQISIQVTLTMKQSKVISLLQYHSILVS